MSDELRQKVLVEAKSWLGTPFHHAARVKGAGVDCGQFLIEVFERCGILEHTEVGDYPPDFHLHHNREWYVEELSQYCEVVDLPTYPADVVLFKIGRVFSHGAIVIEWPKFIHSYVGHGVGYGFADQGRLRGRDIKLFRPRVFL